MPWALLTVADKIRLALIAVLLALSIVVDSVVYIVSALSDAVFIGGAVFLAIPLVKRIIK